MVRCLWEDEDINKMLQTEKFSSIIGAEDERGALNWIENVYRCY